MVKNPSRKRLIAENRKARFHYELLEKYEAGIVLLGTEVKALRAHGANVAESYASFEEGELWLINSYIVEYSKGNRFNHEPRRLRKLLLHKKELKKLFNATTREGMTIVPLEIYFNSDGRVKLSLAVARGKKLFDKRETEKKRDWGRQKARLLKHA